MHDSEPSCEFDRHVDRRFLASGELGADELAALRAFFSRSGVPPGKKQEFVDGLSRLARAALLSALCSQREEICRMRAMLVALRDAPNGTHSSHEEEIRMLRDRLATLRGAPRGARK